MANGAQLEFGTNRLFVRGEVPSALMSFVPKPVRQAMPEYGPSCPACNAHMVRRTSRKGDFWGCSRFPACTGRAAWEYDIARLKDVWDGRQMTSHGNRAGDRSQVGNADERIALRRRWFGILDEATKKFGHVLAAERWLGRPMVGLGGRTPKQAMGTSDGCEEVERLLRSLPD